MKEGPLILSVNVDDNACCLRNMAFLWPDTGLAERLVCWWFLGGHCGTLGKHLAVRRPQPLLLPSQSSLPEFLTDLDGVWTANAEPGFLPPGEVLPLLPDSPQGVQSPCPLGSSQSLLLLGPCRAETSEASVQWWRMSDPALDLRVHSDAACSFILLFLCPF